MVDKRTAMLGILAGGPLAGVLLASALPPQMKPALDSPWRTAAREKALEVDSYAFVDTSYAGYGSQVPWLEPIGTAGSRAAFPEEFYRGRTIPLNADYTVVHQDSYEPEPLREPEPALVDTAEPAAQLAEQTAKQIEPVAVSEIEPAPDQADLTPSESSGDEAEFGG